MHRQAMPRTTSETRAAVSLGEEIELLSLFQGIEAGLLRSIATAARVAHYDKGTVVLAQGQPPANFCIVLEGWCGASKINPEGQEAILQIFRAGDFLTEPDYPALKSANALNVQALASLRLLLVPTGVLQTALERSKILTSNLLAAAMRQSRELRDHVEQLTLFSAEQRVGRFLLQMRFHGSSNGKDKEIVLPFDKSLIAAYLGIKPETFSRTLQFFKEKGFVIDRNHLLVPNRQALCDYCDSSIAQECLHAHTANCPYASSTKTAAG